MHDQTAAATIRKDYILMQFHIYVYTFAYSYSRFFTNLFLIIIQSQLFVSCIVSPINLKMSVLMKLLNNNCEFAMIIYKVIYFFTLCC